MRSMHRLILLSALICGPLSAEETTSAAISYYEMKPSLVVNLASGGKYMRTDIQLMTRDDGFKEQLELHGPAIRHALLMLLSEQDGRNIKTPDGKEALRQEAMNTVSNVMKELSGKDSLQGLFFTTFYVQ